jgi:hypothetical protein
MNSKSRYIIESPNKRAAHFFALILYCLGSIYVVESMNFWLAILIILGSIVGYFVLTYFLQLLFRVRIVLKPNRISIRKIFIGIPYFIRSWNFDEIFELTPNMLEFKGRDSKVAIEDHEGFEVDCLLIVHGEKCYEVGGKDLAKKALQQLKIGIRDLGIELKTATNTV